MAPHCRLACGSWGGLTLKLEAGLSYPPPLVGRSAAFSKDILQLLFQTVSLLFYIFFMGMMMDSRFLAKSSFANSTIRMICFTTDLCLQRFLYIKEFCFDETALSQSVCRKQGKLTWNKGACSTISETKSRFRLVQILVPENEQSSILSFFFSSQVLI